MHRRGGVRAPLRDRGEAAASSLRLEAEGDDAGLRLDAFLAARGAVASRAAGQRLIESGSVLVNGAARAKNHRMADGEVVTVAAEPQDTGVEADEAPTIDVVFEDEHLLVVDKPAGLVTHPAPGHHGPTLAGALRGRATGGDDPQRAGIVHRLDRDTSGLLLVAKSQAAYQALQRQMKARTVRREYLALVSGSPDAESGTIDAPLGRDRAHRTVVSTRSDRPRSAVTHFDVVERLAATALLHVRLETGRTHQIRAHLAAIGLPVCGDRQYGGRACGKRLGLERQFLHAHGLMFSHPIVGESLHCESKPPVELRRALDAARREPVSGGPDGD